jgi:polysaccharide export outer membrane protein
MRRICIAIESAFRLRSFRASFGILAACLMVTASLAGCGTAHETGFNEAAVLPPAKLSTTEAPKDYVIGPLDKLNVRVFKVNDLSLDNLQVDATGQIDFPLIGSVKAEGKTTSQLAEEIAAELGSRYLQSPQVTVTVVDSASLKVTVEGEVKNPGVFQMRGRTTLLQAIALGGGVSTTADLHKVAIIRQVDGVRKAAICDYSLIRAGKAPDPVIQGDDVIVVDGSLVKSTWQQVLQTLPLFSLIAVAA